MDVNVHPAKREVKFEKPDEIHRLVKAAVYEALNPGVEVDVSPPRSLKGFGYQHQRGDGFSYPKQDNPVVGESGPTMFSAPQTDFFTSGLTPDVSTFFHVGESFVATVSNDGLIIVDQHAAHERIMYEKYLKKAAIETEPLFLPLRVELPLKEYGLVIKHKDVLNGLGLDVEDFGGNNVIVRSLPKELRKSEMKGLLLDIAAGIQEEETSGIKGAVTEDLLVRNIAARLACHKSVRGDEHLTDVELRQMMQDLDKADEPDKCPHGRPTRIHLSLDELKKMFKRK